MTDKTRLKFVYFRTRAIATRKSISPLSSNIPDIRARIIASHGAGMAQPA
jgi:hypothetical protein